MALKKKNVRGDKECYKIEYCIRWLSRVLVQQEGTHRKFERNGDRATPVYPGINIANLTNNFLRRDGGNTAIGSIGMNRNIIKNVADPLSNQGVATKNYVDKNAFASDGVVVSGDIKLSVGSDLVRSLGYNDLTAGKKLTFLLGSDTNMLSYSVPN